MDTISLKSVIPNIFADKENIESEIWNREVSFEKNKIYLLEAGSGKGKSTFCSYLIGYRKDYTGELLFDKNPVSQYGRVEWTKVRRLHLSCLFQELRMFQELTGFENVMIKNSLTNYKTEKHIRSWFDRLNISDKINTPIGLMSLGQQQRVAMLRCLAQPFDFLIADEPISHLDDINSAAMAELMLEEAHSQGAGIIMTSIGKHMDIKYDRIMCL